MSLGKQTHFRREHCRRIKDLCVSAVCISFGCVQFYSTRIHFRTFVNLYQENVINVWNRNALIYESHRRTQAQFTQKIRSQVFCHIEFQFDFQFDQKQLYNDCESKNWDLVGYTVFCKTHFKITRQQRSSVPLLYRSSTIVDKGRLTQAVRSKRREFFYSS